MFISSYVKLLNRFMKKIFVATVFSGIGAFEQALMKLNIPHEIVFACDTGERYVDFDYENIKSLTSGMNNSDREKYISNLYDSTKKPNYVKQSYFANYKIKQDNWFTDLRFIDGNEYKNKVDIFVGGSPCQSFSAIGKRKGLEDTRGTLFYDYARLVKEIQPKVFIFENVPGMLNHDCGKTWEIIKDTFLRLGYKVFFQILNSINFGIPQDRQRLFVIGFKDKTIHFSFPKPITLTTTMFDYLEKNVDSKHYLGKKGFEFVTNPKYKNRAKVNSSIIRTQKANQQFNWNGDFVFEELDNNKHNVEILQRAYVGEWNGKKGVCRQLSYRECLRLMGFSDSFKIVVPNVAAYRQSGNSIVVNVLEALIKEIIKTGAL